MQRRLTTLDANQFQVLEGIRRIQEKDRPIGTLLEAAWAAMEQENVVTSGINWFNRPERPRKVPGYNPFADEKELEGFENFLTQFSGSESPAETLQIKAQIRHENRNRQILHSQGWTGFFLQMGAGILSPENLIPVGAAVRSASAGGRILSTAATTAKAGFLGASMAELGLSATQRTRTAEESILNVSAATILSGVLGGAVGSMSEGLVKAVTALDEATHGKSAGAAVAEPAEEVLAAAYERYQLERGFDGVVDGEAFAKLVVDLTPEANRADLKMLPRTLLRMGMTPVARWSLSSNPVVRTIAKRFFKTPIPIKEGDLATVGVDLESLIDRMMGEHWLVRAELKDIHSKAADEAAKKGEKYPGPITFREQLRRALSDMTDDQRATADPHIVKAFDRIREFMDPAEDLLKEVGFLPMRLNVKFAEHYFPRIYDAQKVQANQAAVHERLTRSFQEHNGLDFAEASHRADDTISNMINDPTGGLANGAHTKDGARFIAERQVPLTDTELMDLGILRTDIDGILESFSARMLSRAIVAKAMNPARSARLKAINGRMKAIAEDLEAVDAPADMLRIDRDMHYLKATIIIDHAGNTKQFHRVEKIDKGIEDLHTIEDAILAEKANPTEAVDGAPSKLSELEAQRDEIIGKLDEHVEAARQIDSQSAAMLKLDSKYKKPSHKVTKEEEGTEATGPDAKELDTVEFDRHMLEIEKDLLEKEAGSFSDDLDELVQKARDAESELRAAEDADDGLEVKATPQQAELERLDKAFWGEQDALEDALRVRPGEDVSSEKDLELSLPHLDAIRDIEQSLEGLRSSLPPELERLYDALEAKRVSSSPAAEAAAEAEIKAAKAELEGDGLLTPREKITALEDQAIQVDATIRDLEGSTSKRDQRILRKLKRQQPDIQKKLNELRKADGQGRDRVSRAYEAKVKAEEALEEMYARDDLVDLSEAIDDLELQIDTLNARYEELTATPATPAKPGKKKLVKERVTEEVLANDPAARNRFFEKLEDKVFLTQRINAEASSRVTAFTRQAINAFDAEIKKLSAKGDKKSLKKIEKIRKEKKNFDADMQLTIRQMYRENASQGDPVSIAFRASNVVRAGNFLSLGGGFTISSIPDMGLTVLKHGLGTYLKAFVAVMQNPALLKMAKEQKHFVAAEMAGSQRWMNLADLESNAYTAGASDIMGVVENLTETLSHGRTVDMNTQPLGGAGAKIFGLGRGEFAGMGKLSFLSHWNAYMSSFTSLMSAHNIIEASVRFANGSPIKKNRMARLREQGFTDQDFRAIAEQYKKHGRKEGSLRLSGSDDWDHPVSGQFQGAVHNDVRNTILTIGMGELPRSARDPWLRMLFQFRTFGIAANQAITVPGLARPDMSVLSGVIAAVSFGALSEMLHAGFNTRREVDMDHLLRQAVDRSGVLGLVTEYDNILEKVTGYGVMGAAFGGQSQRYRSRNMLDALFGPSIGAVTNVGRVAHDSAQAEFDQGTLNTTRRLAPYQNLFWLRWAFDKVQGNLDNLVPERAE